MRRLLALLIAIGALRSPLAAQGSDPVLERGIEAMLKFTKALVERDDINSQVIGGYQAGYGLLSLQLYALLSCGVPVRAEVVKRGFERLEDMKFNFNYSTSIYAFALDAAIAQLEEEQFLIKPTKTRDKYRNDPKIAPRYRARLYGAIESLLKAQEQHTTNVWSYRPGQGGEYDNSNVQFAVFALGVGANRGVPISENSWRSVLHHFVNTQQASGYLSTKRLVYEDGHSQGISGAKKKKKSKKSAARARGWSYQTRINPKATNYIAERHTNAKFQLTCAAVSSLLLVKRNLGDDLESSEREALDLALRDGYAYIMEHWNPTSEYYDMYSLEKVGDLARIRKFDNIDWYEDLRNYLRDRQNPDGTWTGRKMSDDERVASSWALLIYTRATGLLNSDGSRIIYSGRDAAEKGKEQDWVYFPKLKQSLYYPALLRKIRFRPTAEILELFNVVLDGTDKRKKCLLIPHFVGVVESSDNRRATRFARKSLKRITGVTYKATEDYAKWYRRWLRVMAIVESSEERHVTTLLKYYENTSRSTALRKTIMWALMRLKARQALPLYLDDLEHKDPTVRLAAYDNFRAFFVDFPPEFDANANRQKRKEQVEFVKDWYRQQLEK